MDTVGIIGLGVGGKIEYRSGFSMASCCLRGRLRCCFLYFFIDRTPLSLYCLAFFLCLSKQPLNHNNLSTTFRTMARISTIVIVSVSGNPVQWFL